MGLDIPLMAACQGSIVTSDFWLIPGAQRLQIAIVSNRTWRISTIGQSAAQSVNRFRSRPSGGRVRGELAAVFRTWRRERRER